MYDFYMTSTGDLKFRNGDLDLVDQETLVKQIIFNAMSTSNRDWIDYPNISSGFTDGIGEANSRESSEALALSLRDALNALNLYAFASFNVKPVPIGYDEVLLHVTSPSGFNIDITINFQAGAVTDITNNVN